MSLNIFANYKKSHLVYNKPPIVFNFVIIITGISTVFDTIKTFIMLLSANADFLGSI